MRANLGSGESVMSDLHRAQRAEVLFLSAAAMEPEARRAFLDGLAEDDRDLEGEVLSLLEHHDASSGFLSTPAVDLEDVATTRTQPAHIGGYRIVDELGEGGMGVVYLAEQEHPRRTVALKVLRPGIASPRSLRRFEHEAQVLARLQHPCIAQVYEAGTADYGQGPQPFFAMEYVRGPTLAEWVEKEKLGTRGRLELLAQVCDALEHAHQRHVIHRDLKPSNVLVDGASGARQVKVLDFGIARVTDGEGGTTSLRTDVGQVIGTVPYMSPEQAGGDPAAIDHRSDVYALGALGYELLCGRLPLDVVGKPLHEAVRVVREDEPTPLSRVVPTLRGDVETIFAKALEKDRERRYATSAALAADLRRYLSDRPIVARPPNRFYLLSKFARRNKGLVGGAAAVVLALAAGLAATLRQARLAEDAAARADQEARRANREARRAWAVARFQREMLSRVQLDRDGRDVKLAAVLDAGASALPGDLAGDPAAEGGVRAMLGESYHALGLLEPAEEQFRAALALFGRGLGANHEEALRAQGWLATTLADRGRAEEALEWTERTYQGMRARLGPRDAETLTIELTLAQAWLDFGRAAEGERLARENLDARREIFGESDPRFLTALGVLGQCLSSRGAFAEAEPLFRRAFDVGRGIEGEEHPHTLIRGGQLAAVLQQQDRFEEAEVLYRRVLEPGRAVFGEEHFELLAWEHNLAAVLEKRGNPGEAERLYRRGLEAATRKLGERHESTLITLHSLARAVARQGRHADAEPLFRRLVEACAGSGEDGLRAKARESYGACLLELGRYAEAETELLAALEANQAAPSSVERRLEALYLAWGKPELAARYLPASK